MKINEMYEGDDLDFDMSVGGDSETDFEQEAMQVQLMKIEDEPDIEQQLRFEIRITHAQYRPHDPAWGRCFAVIFGSL